MCRPQYPELFVVPVGYASTLIAPVSHFDYHMLALLPMSVLAYLALVKTDSLLTTLARVTLIVYLLASVCTLALPPLQYIGLFMLDDTGAVGGVTVCCGSARHAPGGFDHSKTPIC